MATIQDIQAIVNQLGFDPDRDDYFGITVDFGDDDDSYTAYNNPATTTFCDLDATLVNLQGFDADSDQSIWDCFV